MSPDADDRIKEIVELKNVSMPSGILWSAKTIIDIIPTLYNDDSFVLILLIRYVIIIHTINTSNIINSAFIFRMDSILIIDEGSKSKSDIIIITLNEKESENDINLFIYLSLILIKIGITPIIVDIPDIKVRIKAYLIFIIIYMHDQIFPW